MGNDIHIDIAGDITNGAGDVIDSDLLAVVVAAAYQGRDYAMVTMGGERFNCPFVSGGREIDFEAIEQWVESLGYTVVREVAADAPAPEGQWRTLMDFHLATAVPTEAL